VSDALLSIAVLFILFMPVLVIGGCSIWYRQQMKELEENLRLRRKEYQKRKVESEKFIAESKKRTAELQHRLADLRRHRNRTLGPAPLTREEVSEQP
jgi:uncharacterized protein HemX